MESFAIITLTFAASAFCAGMVWVLYDLFFKKNPNDLTRVESRYVETQTDVQAAEAYIKTGTEKIRTKV